MRHLCDTCPSSPSPACPLHLGFSPSASRGEDGTIFLRPCGAGLYSRPSYAEPRACSSSAHSPCEPSPLPVKLFFPASDILPGEGKPCPRGCSLPLRTPRGRKSQVEGSHRSEGCTPPPTPRSAGRSLTRGAVGCRPPRLPRPPPPPRYRAG